MELTEHYGSLIKLLSENIEKNVNLELHRHSLTGSQVRVMVLLHDSENRRLTLKELEAAMRTSQPTMVGIVGRLELKGMVRTASVPHDRRVKMVILTETGIEAAETAIHVLRDIESRYTRGFSEEEKGQLISLLNRVMVNMY